MANQYNRNKKRSKHPGAWSSWNNMKQRCNNPKNPHFKNYGGRGISYDKSWELFDNFLLDMGDRDLSKSLDRIDVNSGYSKNNCKWSSRSEQQRNQRVHVNSDVGVSYDKKHPTHNWQVGISVNNRRIASRFKTKEEAIEWRIKKEKELWKQERV